MSWFARGQSGGGGGGALYTGVWSGRPDPVANPGAQIVVTDVPLGGGRSFWYSDGTFWRPQSPTVLAYKSSVTVGLIKTAEQIIGVLGPVPAGVLSGATFQVRVSWGRTAVSDTFATPTTMRLGTAGTLADSVLRSFSISGSLSNVNSSVSFSGESAFIYDTDTSVIGIGLQTPLGSSSALSPFNPGSGGQSQLNGAYAVPSLAANDLYVSFSTAMNAATTSAPKTGYCELLRIF